MLERYVNASFAAPDFTARPTGSRQRLEPVSAVNWRRPSDFPFRLSRALTRAGFEIKAREGLGSPLLLALDRPLRWVRNTFGDGMAVPLFLALLPLSWLDRTNPDVPISLYVRAVKPES